MAKITNICYGCMNIIQDNSVPCPYCHFHLSLYQGNENALVPGTILNQKYLIGRTLGVGGFGITYLARDMYLQTKIAIKEFYPANLVNRNSSMSKEVTVHTYTSQGNQDFEMGMRRYIREAEILSHFFNLPGIVSVKDFFYENGTAYIVMEYVDGISLKQYIEQKGGVLGVNETLNIMKPILASLDVIHKNKVLHRDISPDNIMISKEGAVKLIDFGAARVYENGGEKSMTVVLKRGYAPIEQYSRNGEQGVWTDVYGICATMYRMISGNVPCESAERVVRDDIMNVRKYNRKIPKHVAAAIMKGLSVKAENRQQSIKELYDDLYNVEIYEERKRKKLIGVLIGILISLISLLIVGGIVTYKWAYPHYLSGIETEAKEEAQRERREKKTSEKAKNTDTKEVEKSTEERLENTEQEQEKEKGQEEEQAEAGTEEVQVVEQQDEQDLGYKIMVARDGTFNSRSTMMTVGEIFDFYSDVPGTWNAEKNENGEIFVYYTGVRNGKEYMIQFQVYENDTFRITGAKQNGEFIAEYNTYIQSILEAVGV